MIDRHYGHLARDGREHALRLLDELRGATATVDAGGRCVDVDIGDRSQPRQRNCQLSRKNSKPSDGLEPSTPSL
jgi:hypothetical protein